MRWEGPLAGIPDAIVRRVTELPDRLERGERAGFYAEAVPGRLLQIVPGVARYLVSDGLIVEVMPELGAEDSAIEIFLNGAVRAALIHQRGELPLHGATLIAPGSEGAVAICGASGTGKSTLAAELSRRGWLLIADDTTRVTWDGARALAWPGRGAIKLWEDACRNRGDNTSGLERVRTGMEKFFVPAPVRNEITPLAAVVELRLGSPEGMSVVSGLERVALLSEQTFRPRQIKPLGRLAEHLRIVTRVAGCARAYRLGGARRLTVGELADRLVEAAL